MLTPTARMINSLFGPATTSVLPGKLPRTGLYLNETASARPFNPYTVVSERQMHGQLQEPVAADGLPNNSEVAVALCRDHGWPPVSATITLWILACKLS